MSVEFPTAIPSGALSKKVISKPTDRHGCPGIMYIKYLPVLEMPGFIPEIMMQKTFS